MSYDFDTTLTLCDHFHKRERMVIDQEDWQTLLCESDSYQKMRAPIANASLVALYIHGTPVPQNHPVYGWEVVEDGVSELDPTLRLRMIRFKRPVRVNGLLIEVDYNTIPSHCLKCMGAGKKNDLIPSQTRSFVRMSEHSKLLQKVLKHILTSSCAFYPTYTCQLKEYVGRKFGVSLVEEDLSYEVSQALDNLKRIQGLQRGIQDLSPQEMLKAIEKIKVVRSEEDPSRVKVSVQVSSYGKERPSPLSFTLRSNR
jgi:hypothetical protein